MSCHCRNPFQSPGEWLKVGIHIHTDRSDGAVSPAQAVAAYKARGYDVLVFGDHWHVTVPEDVPPEMVLIPGAEYGARLAEDPAGTHFMAVGMQEGHDDELRSLRDEPYTMAEALMELCEYLVLAHPYWSALTTELIARLPGLPALEVYNHGCEVEDGLGCANYVWDQLLARGERWDAVAADDAHWRRDDDRFGGWVMLKAEQRTPEAVIAALKGGSFYATGGPEIHSVEFSGPRHVQARSSPVRSILFRCNGSLGDGLHAAGPGGSLTEAEHILPDRACFVRVEVTDQAGRKAWSNPFYLEG